VTVLVCPSVSPETQERCALPDTFSVHRAGHESNRDADGACVSWATTLEDRGRWAGRQ
jgi:hypothetical protein